MNNSEQPIILIVDDNPTNLKVLSGAIADSGWEILVATDGESAIDLEAPFFEGRTEVWV